MTTFQFRFGFEFETEEARYQELLQISSDVAPPLIPLLEYAREGGMVVERKKSGPKIGMLNISNSPIKGADYSRWDRLNCGPGRKMYEQVQAESKLRWDARHTPAANPSPNSQVHP